MGDALGMARAMKALRPKRFLYKSFVGTPADVAELLTRLRNDVELAADANGHPLLHFVAMNPETLCVIVLCAEDKD